MCRRSQGWSWVSSPPVARSRKNAHFAARCHEPAPLSAWESSMAELGDLPGPSHRTPVRHGACFVKPSHYDASLASDLARPPRMPM
jgi:hypothetical protein